MLTEVGVLCSQFAEFDFKVIGEVLVENRFAALEGNEKSVYKKSLLIKC